MKFILTSLVLLFNLQVSLASSSRKLVNYKTDHFVIIGAGATGLTAARTLLTAGVLPSQITILERNKTAGGKVNSISIDGRPYEMGAQMMIPGLYKDIENLQKEFGFTTHDLQRGFSFDITTGATAPF